MDHLAESKFTNWIFNSFSITSEGLGLYRIFASLYILLYLLPSTKSFDFIGSVPADFFNPPPGPVSLMNSFPPTWLLYALFYTLIVLLLCMLVGYFTQISSLLVGTILLLLKGVMFGLGKIDHDLLLIIVPILMAFSGWGEAYSVDACRKAKSNHAQTWVLTLLALLIGFMFFTAGFPKILGGWLDLNTHATEGHFYKQYYVRGRQDLLANYALGFKGMVWEISDYITILFEISFIVAILNPRSTRIYICLAAFFHLSIMLILNIPFLPNFLAYAAFFNWSWLASVLGINAQKRLIDRTIIHYAPPVVVAGGMILYFFLLYSLKGQVILHSDLTIYAVGLVPLFAIIAAIYFFKEFFNLASTT